MVFDTVKNINNYCYQGRNEGGQGHNSRGAEKSQQCRKFFLHPQYIYFRKTSYSNMGLPNLFLAPGAIWLHYAPGYYT